MSRLFSEERRGVDGDYDGESTKSHRRRCRHPQHRKTSKIYNTKPFCADSEQFVPPPRVSSPSPSTNSQKKERGIVWWGGTENSLIGECGLVVKLHRFSVPFFSSTSHNSLRPHKISSTFFPSVSPVPPQNESFWWERIRKAHNTTYRRHSHWTTSWLTQSTLETKTKGREKIAISSSF